MPWVDVLDGLHNFVPPGQQVVLQVKNSLSFRHWHSRSFHLGVQAGELAQGDVDCLAVTHFGAAVQGAQALLVFHARLVNTGCELFHGSHENLGPGDALLAGSVLSDGEIELHHDVAHGLGDDGANGTLSENEQEQLSVDAVQHLHEFLWRNRVRLSSAPVAVVVGRMLDGDFIAVDKLHGLAFANDEAALSLQ